MLVPELLEVPLERSVAPVGIVAADLALELLVESVQLVQPIRYGLSVPSQRKLQRVVDNVLVVVISIQVHARCRRRRILKTLLVVFHLRNELFVRACGLLLHLALGVSHRGFEQIHQRLYLALQERHALCHLQSPLRFPLVLHWSFPLCEEFRIQFFQSLAFGFHQPLRLLPRRPPCLQTHRNERLFDSIGTQRSLEVAARLERLQIDQAWVSLKPSRRRPQSLVFPTLHFTPFPLLHEVSLDVRERVVEARKRLSFLIKTVQIIQQLLQVRPVGLSVQLGNGSDVSKRREDFEKLQIRDALLAEFRVLEFAMELVEVQEFPVSFLSAEVDFRLRRQVTRFLFFHAGNLEARVPPVVVAHVL
mmetsp:Transcript_2050/g.3260  ORF Transcript_2050/g.3260 Transcript_2050/m.3260 type:complete len:362 (-) Transcript_2050:287-1372(-)